MVLAHLCQNATLRDDIFNHTTTQNPSEWCYQTYQHLKQHHMKAEKFYPPGRVFYINDLGDEVNLQEVHAEDQFFEVLLHTRMLDLSRHVPNRYEDDLQQLLSLQKDSCSN